VPQQRNWVRAYKHLVAKPTCVRRPKFRQPLKLLVPAYPLVRNAGENHFGGGEDIIADCNSATGVYRVVEILLGRA